MDRGIIARQVKALATDLSDVAGAMVAELEAEAEVEEENKRTRKENLKRSGAGTALAALRTTTYSPINHYRSRLEFVKTRLVGTIEYMRQKQVW